jgi:hypothetical protein
VWVKTVAPKLAKPFQHLPSYFAHEDEVESRFILAIQCQQAIKLVVQECASGTSTQSHRCSCRVKVLCDVICLQQHVAIGRLAIFPTRALEDGRENEANLSLPQHLLVDPGHDQRGSHIASSQPPQGVVGHGVVVAAR